MNVYEVIVHEGPGPDSTSLGLFASKFSANRFARKSAWDMTVQNRADDLRLGRKFVGGIDYLWYEREYTFYVRARTVEP